MQKTHLVIFMLAALICLGSFIYLSNRDPKNVSYGEMQRQAIKDGIAAKIQERVSCGSTNPPRCFRYRCDTSYIYTEPIAAPGLVPLRCTDGSSIREIGEVPFPDSTEK